MNAPRPTWLLPGEPAPWFACRSSSRDDFTFDSVAGRFVVLSFFGSASDAASAELLRGIEAARARFDDVHLSFFGVSDDADDERLQRVPAALPGLRCFWDFDRGVAARFGAVADGRVRPVTYVLDPMLRVLATLPLAPGAAGRLMAVLDRLPKFAPPYLAPLQAPVLMLPGIFEPALCEALVALYDREGGLDSGFMRDVDGQTTRVIQHDFKRRRDCLIRDPSLRQAVTARLRQRLVPEIHKAFQFQATRIERYLIACYDAEEGGHFAPHRDNLTRGTAHRRFAVSLFLNTGEYEGGLLRFPEFGSALYAAPPGGAVVFSCSLLHQALPVTRGRRFMFLPFLHDDAAEQVRAANLVHIDPAVRVAWGAGRATPPASID